MSASAVAKWVRLGFTGAAGTLALVAMAPYFTAGSAKAAEAAMGGPEAQAPAPAGDAAAKLAKGKDLFNTWSCGTCHSLKDAEASGHVGPAFDGNANLTEAFIIDRVTNGQGPMPAFGGQLSEEEIADVAAYIKQVAAK